MRYGVCFSLENTQQIKLAKDAGFDYVEGHFQQIAGGEDAMLSNIAAALKENHIACESAYCFLPGRLNIIGTDYARKEMTQFIENGFRRGKELGLETVVFGSGGARALPQGVSFDKGFLQLGAFLREVVSPLAAKYDVTVVIEPLRKAECNMIHTLDEGVMLAAISGQPNIACLADVYHMWGAGETFDDIRRLSGCIRHGHISNPEPADKEAKRTFPMDKNEFDYAGFVSALAYAGCRRCSVEARCFDFETEIKKAGEVLRSL